LNVDDIKAWLMKQPRPAVVAVTALDGALHEVTCQGQWMAIAETLSALHPELLQAKAADGKLLRAIRPNDQTEDWSDEGNPPQRVPSLHAIPITSSDPETQRFALVAQLLADAYKSCNAGLVRLLNAQNDKAGDVERAREAIYTAHIRQLEAQIKELGAEPQGGGGDMFETMLAQFMGGVATARAQQHPSAPPPPPPPPTANGKH